MNLLLILYYGGEKKPSMKSQALNFNLNYNQSKVPNPRIKDLLIPLTIIFTSLSKILYVKNK